jgi:hypothetical protein
MKTISFACAGVVLFTSWAHAGQALDAEAVKTLTVGNTAHGMEAHFGNPQRIYFASDGWAFIEGGGAVVKSEWLIKDSGTQCISSMGACYNIVRNDDGTYDRVLPDGKVVQKWTSVTEGKDF